MFFAIEDTSVLLPTPGPEKMPMRCPNPQLSSPSIARMPVASDWRIGSRESGATLVPSMRRKPLVGSGPLPSIGSPMPLSTRPSSCGAHQTRGVVARFSMTSPREMPAIGVSGISSVRSLCRPITSATHLRPPWLRMRQVDPSGSGRSTASIVSPLIACTLPATRMSMADSTVSSCACR
jgi:hypothetical protein